MLPLPACWWHSAWLHGEEGALCCLTGKPQGKRVPRLCSVQEPPRSQPNVSVEQGLLLIGGLRSGLEGSWLGFGAGRGLCRQGLCGGSRPFRPG